MARTARTNDSAQAPRKKRRGSPTKQGKTRRTYAPSREFDIQRDLWVSFDNGRVPGDAMFPMPLEALP